MHLFLFSRPFLVIIYSFFPFIINYTFSIYLWKKKVLQGYADPEESDRGKRQLMRAVW